MTTTKATAAAQLAQHGITGNDLHDITHAIAHTYITRTDSALGPRIDDLAQHLALTACRRIQKYDPEKGTIRTWLWNALQPACVDWHRRKAEGFGDRRYGHDNRMTLTNTQTEPIHDPDQDYEYDFGKLATDDRKNEWRKAALKTGWPIEEWIVISLDQLAGQINQAA